MHSFYSIKGGNHAATTAFITTATLLSTNTTWSYQRGKSLTTKEANNRRSSFTTFAQQLSVCLCSTRQLSVYNMSTYLEDIIKHFSTTWDCSATFYHIGIRLHIWSALWFHMTCYKTAAWILLQYSDLSLSSDISVRACLIWRWENTILSSYFKHTVLSLSSIYIPHLRSIWRPNEATLLLK